MSIHRVPTPYLLPAATALAVCLMGCEAGEGGDRNVQDPPVAPAPGQSEARGASRPGIRFDPATLGPGDRVGELVADSIEARWAAIDSSHVGVARFAGQITLSGWTMLHPDPDLRAIALCFEADPASAARLPRWLGDERRPWFCFENPADAAGALGPPSEGVAANVVVEAFAIHRGLTDEVNSARFVRVADPEDPSAGV